MRKVKTANVLHYILAEKLTEEMREFATKKGLVVDGFVLVQNRYVTSPKSVDYIFDEKGVGHRPKPEGELI